MAAVQLRPSQCVAFADLTPPNSDAFCAESSSPAQASTLIPHSSPGVTPLGPAKTVVINRRAVIFSPRNDTKYFDSAESILNSSRSAPPPSIRSYLDSDPFAPSETPWISRSSSQPPSDTPYNPRGIMKLRVHEIRLAASAEEGTLNNKEAARLLVSGLRPKLVARDSFQLAMMRQGAGDNGKGMGNMPDDMPGSDDSTSSVESVEPQALERGESSEREEEIEMDGAMATGSLLSIILDGAEDLLTLEEAYNTLTLRLRQRIPIDAPSASIGEATREDIRIAVQPIRDEAPAMVRAMQRDLQRLMGKVPNAECGSSEKDSSHFRTLIPLRDSTPVNGQQRLTPSPTPTGSRQGYSESEVRYRRESSGVGAATLKFLSFTLHTPHLFTCFSEVDLQALLEQVLIIPRTPQLPTPNPKRTYYLSILVLAQIRVPAVCVQPIRERIAGAVESAINASLASGTLAGKDGVGQIRKEGFRAVANLVSNYPSIFFQHYSELLPGCLRALYSSSSEYRRRAASAAAAFAAAKYSLLADLQNRLPEQKEAWTRTKALALKSESFVVSHLKSNLKPGRSYATDGEKRTEWTAMEQIFKETVGAATEVHWACAIWAVMVSLIGSAYNSSGSAAGFDHIMDRSLQPSTNALRPLLARTAWNHAIHAYLSSGSATSLSSEDRVIRSFKPFAASYHQDVPDRLATIQTPVELALAVAIDPKGFSKALFPVGESEEVRYTWQRQEKAKKIQWVITCGLGAATVVYAYSGIALRHEDQPAKEMTAVTGLPSSDGAPVPASSLETSRLDRLDKTWQKVVAPMLKSFGSICGIDRLKVHGWAILDAITSQREVPWTLDRLLSARYLSGEVFEIDKPTALNALLDELEADLITASDIPSWGAAWVLRHLSQLLDLFQECLLGISGINNPTSVRWARDEDGKALIPLVISRVWTNLLRALATIKEDGSSPGYIEGLQAVSQHLMLVSNCKPVSYVPISLLDSEGRCTLDADTMRIGLVTHLMNAMMECLGPDAVGGARIALDMGRVGHDGDADIEDGIALGAGSDGQSTIAGNLLTHLLRQDHFSLPLRTAAKLSLKRLVEKLLDVGCVYNCNKLLGDLTNRMPWIFQAQEEIQLDVWRLLAHKWTEFINSQPSSSSGTNHTGALLVSLLSGPFRGRQVTSVWHQHANQQDLAAWQSLLKATVSRFRQKGVGANLGVLESLAGHLGDFLDQNEKANSTTITLSCLASATLYMAFGPTQHHPTAHFSINENYVPVDFLTLVSNALFDSYPEDEASEQHKEITVSPAVSDLLQTLQTVFERVPLESAGPLLAPVKSGLAAWMADVTRIVDNDLAVGLDDLYATLLSVLGRAIEADHIPATSETLDDLLDIYGPRLSRARSSAVPTAFRDFWRRAFQNVQLDYSEDVAHFLRDVMAAVPGMITTSGLAVPDSWSEHESLERYPHSQSLVVRAIPVEVPKGIDLALAVEKLVDDSAFEVETSAGVHDDPTGEYDADVSQSIEEPPKPPPMPAMATVSRQPTQDPSHTESERLVSDVASPPDHTEEQDVFGPTTMAQPRMTRKRSTKRPLRDAPRESSSPFNWNEPKTMTVAPEDKSAKPESSSASNSLPDHKVNLVAGSGDGLDGRIEVRDYSPRSQRPPRSRSIARRSSIPPVASKPSILSSASRWLSRVPSFGGLFNPVRPPVDEDTSTTDQSDRSARKARRTKQKAAQEGTSITESESVTRSSSYTATRKRKLVPVVDLTERKRRRISGNGSTPAVQVAEGDGDDELLLSPESARSRRSEEEGAIAEATALKVQSSVVQPVGKVESQESQGSSGRFDDAPEDHSIAAGRLVASPGPSTGHPTPTKRSTQQERVLAMVEQAARARTAIESMDLEGVLSLLRSVEELRTAATANLQAKAEDARRLKRAHRE